MSEREGPPTPGTVMTLRMLGTVVATTMLLGRSLPRPPERARDEPFANDDMQSWQPTVTLCSERQPRHIGDRRGMSATLQCGPSASSLATSGLLIFPDGNHGASSYGTTMIFRGTL